MVLNREEIEYAMRAGEIVISPFDERAFRSASYVFSVGATLMRHSRVEQAVTLTGAVGDDRHATEVEIPDAGYALEPGGFAVVRVAERLRLGSTVVCFLSARRTCANAGLSILLSDAFVEPDWEGVLTIPVHNCGPNTVLLRRDVGFVKGVFMMTTTRARNEASTSAHANPANRRRGPRLN